tara:strand:- start:4263 stop:4772 length:510 start_codon:yes stop_codon:yes gene_type:complete
MTEYYNSTTKNIATWEQIKKDNFETSFPKLPNADILTSFGYSAVFETPVPLPSATTKKVFRDGVEQDADKRWVFKWSETDRFSDYESTDSDGKKITVTKSEQDADYQKQLDSSVASSMRNQRNALLAETDWMACSDVTMSSAWKTYRQALRDLPAQSGFPDVDFPTKPS